MALQPSINLCLRSNCTELIFTETTGVYSGSNTGGYGAPNTSLGTIVSAVLTVTDPDGEEYTIDLFNTFPTTDDDYEYTIDLADLGDRDEIEDGYWQFSYTVNDGSTNYTGTYATVFTCSINCCLKNMLVNLRLSDCDSCTDIYSYEEYVKVLALRDSLHDAATCGDTEYIDDTLELLQRMCNRTTCKTCN